MVLSFEKAVKEVDEVVVSLYNAFSQEIDEQLKGNFTATVDFTSLIGQYHKLILTKVAEQLDNDYTNFGWFVLCTQSSIKVGMKNGNFEKLKERLNEISS